MAPDDHGGGSRHQPPSLRLGHRGMPVRQQQARRLLRQRQREAKALNGVHTLTGNAFIQTHSTPNTYNSITLIDAGGNTISGNTWGFVQPSWASTYKYIIAATFPVLRGREKYPSVISGNNILPGTYGTAAFSVDPQDVVSGNSP